MSDVPTRLFHDYDKGLISRRHLLQALGVAAALRPLSAFAQGQCGDRGRAGQPGCETTLAPPPFEPTGWKTVVLDCLSVQVADVEKEAAYYQALMNWKLRSYDGKIAMLDIGDWGGLEIRGGYQPPAPATPPPAPATPPAGGDPAAAGRGGGRGGGRGPAMAAFGSYTWGIEPWDAQKVEAELKKRGLNPVADNNGSFQSFRIKDADGFDLRISNGKMRSRRPAGQQKFLTPPPFDATTWKTLFLDHISFETTNYKEQAAFYNALLGWELGQDEGSQNTVKIGKIGGSIIRRGGGGGGRATAAGAAGASATPAPPPPRRARIGHIAFGITPWDPDAVKAELDKRGLNARADTGGSTEIHVAKYQSYHTTTPNGFDLQISNTTS
jgi:catechol 2,3-dioxygenase-like lactoylglutathione lyase family enzyme